MSESAQEQYKRALSRLDEHATTHRTVSLAGEEAYKDEGAKIREITVAATALGEMAARLFDTHEENSAIVKRSGEIADNMRAIFMGQFPDTWESELLNDDPTGSLMGGVFRKLQTQEERTDHIEALDVQLANRYGKLRLRIEELIADLSAPAHFTGFVFTKSLQDISGQTAETYGALAEDDVAIQRTIAEQNRHI